jgi:DNA-binding MarR family transcriptional regulator
LPDRGRERKEGARSCGKKNMCIYSEFMDELTSRIPCALFNLRRTTRAVTQLYDEVLRPSGLKGTQYSMLRVIHGVEPVPIGDLGTAMGMDRTTVTRNVGLLERMGLVAVGPGRDKRTRFVRLTRTGSATLAKAHAHWEAAQQAVVVRLGAKRWEALRAELAAVVEASQEELLAREEP